MMHDDPPINPLASHQTIIFEEPAKLGPYRGKVWRDDTGNYGTYGAGHSLCVEMAKEIERLRKRIRLGVMHPAAYAAHRKDRFFRMSNITKKRQAERVISACHIHNVPVPEHLKAYEKGGAT